MVLLDTCTLLWLVGDQSRLSGTARVTLQENRGRLFVCAISAFEIALKHRKGKLDLPYEPGEWFQAALRFHGLREISIDGVIAARSATLPPHHADPCDRLIVAAATQHGLTILTPDPLIQAYTEARTSW